MKANELMVGDWAFSPEMKQPITIKAILEHNQVIFAQRITNDISNRYLRNCSEIEPIPITPEILEKNGFGEQRLDRMSVWSILGFSVELDFSTWKYYWANGDVEISSVHLLQHALRLCGIDKEIEI